MKTFISNSGKEVVINDASFSEAMSLKNSVVNALKSVDFDFSGLDFNKSDVQDILPNLIDAVLAVDGNQKVIKAVFSCLGRCKYDGLKIQESSFEPVENRVDYYQIVIECIQVNLSPFFESLRLKLSPVISKMTGNLK